MLRLKNIKKDYVMADTTVEALKGISISFRENEFVSILGPSGCGKTTLLNIIGGLDKYSDGTLYIDDISTKKFDDRDWDTYRNHRIGFIFQSYNLIPHQTVLENVELALTIGGVSKDERIKRAKEALDKVGLKDQYNKKPNQLSGGQCQRVAIARALVNEPEILLADEPTGALDTQTSIQIMDLIKEISKDRLVIMVTHNPELAEKYSTRIVKLLDGELTYDSNPFNPKEEEKNQTEKVKKPKLSFWTAFRLSARNLRSKFKRTLMVCFAGSIGIIGVATVLSVSTGITGYVNSMQDDMLSGNPITIAEETINLELMMAGMDASTKNEAIKESVEDGKVNVQYLIEFLAERSEMANNMLVSNDINQEYLDYLAGMPEDIYETIATYYDVDVKNNLYTNISLEEYGEQTMSLSAIEYLYYKMLQETEEFKDYASFVSQVANVFSQYPNNPDFILEQYDIISDPNKSYLPTKENEIMIVVSENTDLTDLLLAQLGYYTQEEFLNICYRATDDEKYNPSLDKNKFTYEELLGKTFTYYPNDTIYNKADATNPMSKSNPFTYNAYEDTNWETGMDLKITAVLRLKEGISYGSLSSGIYYTPAFTKKMINDGVNSEIVKYLNDTEQESFNSTSYNGIGMGITYKISFAINDVLHENITGFVGNTSMMASMMGSMTGQLNEVFTLTLRDLGGIDMPNRIAIYPTNFDLKDQVTDYLDAWNEEGNITINGKIYKLEDRTEIIYTDSLELVINLINNMINIVTYALVAFTALSLVVSTVMIAIITYVSVIERVKEIGVIRSLGGRKKDVSRLFNAEAFIIGLSSGVIGIGVTYLLSALINAIVGSLTGIYTIATLPISIAVIMICISILLTSISGLVPARLASKKDPVVALRTE
ncbi:MAG: ABC transporter ATP-binding protein/permease [Bacilli bacterium]|nr:ABC transporter ATP-binding protein/permease [Bacilli bacterium]